MVNEPTPAVTNWLLVAVTAGAIPVMVIAPTFGVTTWETETVGACPVIVIDPTSGVMVVFSVAANPVIKTDPTPAVIPLFINAASCQNGPKFDHVCKVAPNGI